MSRSYKKNPVMKCAPSDGTIGKKFANRRVRRFGGELSNGSEYKKLFEPWNIHDCVWRYTLNDALEFRTRMIAGIDEGIYRYVDKYDRKYYNIHECIKEWKKDYYWK